MTSLTNYQLLRGNRHFRNLWLGQVVSELGNWFNFLAGLGLVRVVSGAAPDAAAIILVARTAPFAMCAMIAGAYVDRWSRRTVMLVTDFARVAIALGFLLVKSPDDLWIVYLCTVLLSIFGAFFEAAKNAAMPNVTGDDGLLAGNALMFSTRFLLMTIGAGLGGFAAAIFGYEIAFVINAASFLVSAFSIWLIPASEMRKTAAVKESNKSETEMFPRENELLPADFKNSAPARPSVFKDIKEGWQFVRNQPLVLTIIGVNIIWAIGGGAINLIAERLGGVVFADGNGWNADMAVGALYIAAGAGLSIGMLVAPRVGDFVERKKLTAAFIGWSLVLQGVLYGAAGYMPNLWLVMLLMMISRVLLGAEYAVQETMLMRAIPDDLRGRVMTTDRAAEISIFSLSNLVAGWSLYAISPQTLTLVSGVLSAVSGLFWFVRVRTGKTVAPEAETKALDESALAT